MANTYTLINSTSLSTTAASVTFSAIPATFDDLIAVTSLRNTQAVTFSDYVIKLNSVGGTAYSYRYVRGNGATASSSSTSGNSQFNFDKGVVAASSTASTFSSNEIYIPAYTKSQNKPISYFGVTEANATTSYVNASAGLFSNTSAITSIYFESQGTAFASGSTFWLYGIKNS